MRICYIRVRCVFFNAQLLIDASHCVLLQEVIYGKPCKLVYLDTFNLLHDPKQSIALLITQHKNYTAQKRCMCVQCGTFSHLQWIRTCLIQYGKVLSTHFDFILRFNCELILKKRRRKKKRLFLWGSLCGVCVCACVCVQWVCEWVLVRRRVRERITRSTFNLLVTLMKLKSRGGGIHKLDPYNGKI